ncbi:MAG: 4-O-beta-D-mannosyl-D-glucose phosphorylase, partial [Algoriphagus sp.]
MNFNERLAALLKQKENTLTQLNEKERLGNGIFDRYENPILTGDHAPLDWEYDLNPKTNPFLMKRFGINVAFNAGAMKWNGKYVLAVRVEAYNRKSFFAIAESDNGIDNFTFWDYPITMPE